MGLRIAFIGSSGTGKSTLAAFVAEGWQLTMNPVGSRTVSKAMGFDSPYDVDKAGQRAEFQRRLMAEKIAWEADHEDFVTDRTVLDNLAYTALHDVYSIDPVTLVDVKRGMDRYTHVIYCPQWVFCNPGDDPMRVHNPAYQHIYDLLVKAMLDSYRGRAEVLTMDSSELVVRKAAMTALLTG